MIKKLVRAGKHAEVWSQKSNQNHNQNQIQNQKQKNNCNKDDKNTTTSNNNKGQKHGGLDAFKNQQKFPAFISEEDYDIMDDYEDDDEEDEFPFLKPSQLSQLGQLGLLRQQQSLDAKKGAGNNITAASGNNNKMNNNVMNGNSAAAAAAAAAKKGNHNHNHNQNQNQNMGMKINPGLLDQKTLAALKMNNPQLSGLNINAAAASDGKRANEINSMMGFHGNGGANNVSNAAAYGGFQVQPNNGLLHQGSSSAASFPNAAYVTGQQHPSSMLMNPNGYNYPSSSMMNMMNMQNRQAMQQQPQMMYHRSPLIPPSTGYYYNYYNPLPYSFPEVPNYNAADHSAAAAATSHMFSDDNTSSSCSIM